MQFKKIIGKMHLWLGLTSGLVVFVSMLAAALFVWDEELTDWYYADCVFVKEEPTRQPVSELFATARQALPGKEISGVEILHHPNRAYVFTAYQENSQPSGWTHWDDYDYWYQVYVNPYTGQVTGIVNMLTNWIDLTRRLHQNLLLRYDIGHWVIGGATLVIFVMVFTGLVLWFPKNKKVLRQRLKIKWNARWRRVNYDIHNVGGFYTYLLILLFAATGLVWTFDWWTDGIYRLLGNDPDEVFAPHAPPVLQGQPAPHAADVALDDVLQRRQSWQRIYLDLPGAEAEGKIAAFVEFDGSSGWQESDEYTYHPETGQLHWQRRQEDKLLGEKWRNSNYPIHVGSIYGLPTKLLASFVALFCASLPVTGFMIWWGRKKKKSRASVGNGKPEERRQNDTASATVRHNGSVKSRLTQKKLKSHEDK